MTDCWYTPRSISELVTQVLGMIDLDPCADDGKHIAAAHHYTADNDGLSQEWHGRVFMNPPYSCPGKWVAKLQAEYEAGRVSEAIALVPASTDTNWLSPLIEIQPICFWKGRIKFLNTSYKPKQSARQSHCLVYWGENRELFKQVFQQFGVVKNNEKVESGEIKFINEGHKTMTFQFSGTSAIAEQIAQLQEQLNQLTASLKPYQQCQEKAEELRLKVAEYGHEMSETGIPQDDILGWARALYSAASGTELDLGNTAAIASQNEEITKLKCELTAAQRRCDQETVKRLEALTLLQDTTAQRDEAMAEAANIGRESVSRLRALEDKKKELRILLEQNAQKQLEAQSLITEKQEPSTEIVEQVSKSSEGILPQNKQFVSHKFIMGDRVAVVDVGEDDNLEYLIGNKGTVKGVNADNVAVLFEKRIEFDEHEVVLSNRYLMLVSQPNPFIADIKTTSVANKITWENISAACKGSLATFREMRLSATTKIQKSFVENDNLARLMSEYITKTGDITDFDWLEEDFRTDVEALVEAKKSLSYHKGDKVHAQDGSTWEVRSFDGQWLDVTANNMVKCLHSSEVELMQQEVAA